MAAPGGSKLVDRAREAAKKKNYDYAVELFLEHLKVTPGDVEARKELRFVERERFKVNPPGMMQKMKIGAAVTQTRATPVSKKDPEKTIISCEETLKLDPTAVPVLLKLGEAASYANLNDVATAVFEDALTLDNKNIEGLRLLGRVYRATEKLDKALVCFERLHKAAPQDLEGANMVRDIPAQMTSQKVTGQDGKVKGYQDLIDKDAAKKLEQLSSRVRTPEQAKERIEQTLADIESKGGKADNKTWRLLAEWAVMCKDYEKALEFFDKAIAEKPDDYSSKEGKGDVKIKRYEETVKKLEGALKKHPEDDAAGKEKLEAKLEKVQRELLDFTIYEYTERVEAHPTEYYLRLRLGKALYENDQIDECIKQLQQAKQASQCKGEAGYYLGQAFGMKKKIYALAVKELEAAREDMAEMDDLKKKITYLLGRLHEAAKKPDKALAEFSAIAEVDYNFKDVTQRMEKLGSA
jgi:tetratricopeptide (TPR) repeat protein